MRGLVILILELLSLMYSVTGHICVAHVFRFGEVRWVLPSYFWVRRMANARVCGLSWPSGLAWPVGSCMDHDICDHSFVEPECLKVVVQVIHDLLDWYVELGIPSHRIVLGGFGCGGALASIIALRYPRHLAGVVIQNAFIPMYAQRDMVSSIATPFFFSEGDLDTRVSQASKSHTMSWLRKYHWPVHVQAWFLNHCDACLVRRFVLEFILDVMTMRDKACSFIHAELRSFSFPLPRDMSYYISNFDLDNYSQIRGLV